MSLITTVSVNNGASGTIALPVNTALICRRFTRLAISTNGAGAFRQLVEITGCRAAGNVTFTYRSANPAGTAVGHVDNIKHGDEPVVEANTLNTITFSMGSAATWTGMAWYDAIS